MSDKAKVVKRIKTFGKKKNALAVATIEEGHGNIRVNGTPIQLVEPAGLRTKLYEPVLILGGERFKGLNIRVKVRGGGQTAQIYAIRQAICKGIVAFNQKYVDEETKRNIKELILQYDRTMLVADSRRCEPKKYGGHGARARRQKSYR
eukprot:TRINITY_DN81_c0_g1_i38.p1 TRINITY_DN81_c0_g1~~TRINITY_DN81_c0_g1_i38.p1  ORF type:complete len:148 (-),score=42.09 TRINITY_DN81_c0_g1_i38:123-566(-)